MFTSYATLLRKKNTGGRKAGKPRAAWVLPTRHSQGAALVSMKTFELWVNNWCQPRVFGWDWWILCFLFLAAAGNWSLQIFFNSQFREEGSLLGTCSVAAKQGGMLPSLACVVERER